MELKQLRSFAAVIEEGSFTKAAEKIYVSQPAISMHIQKLEEEYQTVLLHRNTRSITATEKGKELYACAKRMIALHDSLLEKWDKKTEVLTIGASTIPCAYILPKVLSRFSDTHPELRIHVLQKDSADVIDDLKNGIIDAGLIGMDITDPLVHCEPVMEDRLVLIAPPGIHETAPSGDLSGLFSLPFIMRESGSGSRKSLEKMLAAAGVDPDCLDIRAEVSDQESIKELVAAGFGISFLSERSAAAEIRTGKLSAFSLPGISPKRNINYVLRKGDESLELLQEFRSAIAETELLTVKTSAKHAMLHGRTF